MSQYTSLSRRQMLLGLSAMAVAPSIGFTADKRRNAGPIIDVHSHFQPAPLKGTPGPMGAWTLQKHMDDMGAAGVTRSIVSITTPGLPAGERGRTLARG